MQNTTSEPKAGFLSRLKAGLSKTTQKWSNSIGQLFVGHKTISPDILEHLETTLIQADIGIATTAKVLEYLRSMLDRNALNDELALRTALKEILEAQLCDTPLVPLMLETQKKPFVILMVGMNGAGKTTTIGKLAHLFQSQGLRVMCAAGDTFRAAAIEQLQTWGERNHIPVIAQQPGADSASVIYDAYQSAKAKNIDVLLADTAGRLHTQVHLMEELKKIKRVLQKCDPAAPHETMLVLDAGIGQNALQQAKEFHEALHVTGIAMTKLDGTAKGGILFAIADALSIPFRYIGVGEDIDSLRPFDKHSFMETLFDDRI